MLVWTLIHPTITVLCDLFSASYAMRGDISWGSQQWFTSWKPPFYVSAFTTLFSSGRVWGTELLCHHYDYPPALQEFIFRRPKVIKIWIILFLQISRDYLYCVESRMGMSSASIISLQGDQIKHAKLPQAFKMKRASSVSGEWNYVAAVASQYSTVLLVWPTILPQIIKHCFLLRRSLCKKCTPRKNWPLVFEANPHISVIPRAKGYPNITSTLLLMPETRSGSGSLSYAVESL